MSVKVKEDLRDVAAHLSAKATYSDAMYELYVRMKVSQGCEDADRGKTIPHLQVKKRFLK